MSKEKLSPEEAFKEGQGIQAWAEGEARKRGSDKEHLIKGDYETASQALDSIQSLDPEWAEELLESAVKAKKWEESVGADLCKKLGQLFQKTWWETLEPAAKKAKKAGLKWSRNAVLEDVRRKLYERITPLLKGKEHLLPIAREIVDDFIESNKNKN